MKPISIGMVLVFTVLAACTDLISHYQVTRYVGTYTHDGRTYAIAEAMAQYIEAPDAVSDLQRRQLTEVNILVSPEAGRPVSLAAYEVVSDCSRFTGLAGCTEQFKADVERRTARDKLAPADSGGEMAY